MALKYCVYWLDIEGKGKREFKDKRSALVFAHQIEAKGAINIVLIKKED